MVLESRRGRAVGTARPGALGAYTQPMARAADYFALEAQVSDGGVRATAARLRRLRASSRNTCRRRPGFSRSTRRSPLSCVAYFSMEFMLSEALPIYSGGLGNVAGRSTQGRERSGRSRSGCRTPVPAGIFSSGAGCRRSAARALSLQRSGAAASRAGAR